MSSETMFDLQQVELAGNRQDLIRTSNDASHGMRDASDLIVELWISRRLREEARDDSDSASQAQGFATFDPEKAVETKSFAACDQRDWMTFCSERKNEDRPSVLDESTSGQTAGSALKSILQKHHARVKSGQDRLLDLRDF